MQQTIYNTDNFLAEHMKQWKTNKQDITTPSNGSNNEQPSVDPLKLHMQKAGTAVKDAWDNKGVVVLINQNKEQQQEDSSDVPNNHDLMETTKSKLAEVGASIQGTVDKGIELMEFDGGDDNKENTSNNQEEDQRAYDADDESKEKPALADSAPSEKDQTNHDKVIAQARTAATEALDEGMEQLQKALDNFNYDAPYGDQGETVERVEEADDSNEENMNNASNDATFLDDLTTKVVEAESAVMDKVELAESQIQDILQDSALAVTKSEDSNGTPSEPLHENSLKIDEEVFDEEKADYFLMEELENLIPKTSQSDHEEK